MVARGEIIHGTYQIVEEIGKGGTGIVYKAWHLNLQKYVVLKKIFNQIVDANALRRETDILKNLHHPYLPQVYDFFNYQGSVYTAMDFIEGVDLEKIRTGIQFLSEDVITSWLTQMADVLDYIHRQNVIHSDIKPGNVIVKPSQEICLIDFNISLQGKQYGRIQGFSANYAAPEQVFIAQEILQGKAPSMALNASADIYSTGALFYHLMSGRLPDSTHPNPKLLTLRTGYSEGLCRVIDTCMEWQRNKRYANGAQLRKAVTSFKKHTAAYRQLIYAQAGCWVLSGLLAGTGIYCVMRGIQENIHNQYNEDYSSFITAFETADYSQAQSIGINILNNNDYADILDENVSEKAGLLHSIGDAYYEQENYSGAVSYYEDALELEDNDDWELDYIIALAYSGNTQKAVEESQSSNLSDSNTVLISAIAAYEDGDYDSALSEINQVIASDTNAITLENAYQLKVNILNDTGNTNETLKTLKEAVSLFSNPNFERQLAAIYYELATNSQYNTVQKEGYADQAIEIYRRINSKSSATKTDQLNYAILLQYRSYYTESISILKELEKEDTDSLQVMIYLAIGYYHTNDLTNAKEYASKAIQQYESADANTQQALAGAYAVLKEIMNASY